MLDNCLFVKTEGDKTYLISLYVDDILIAGSDPKKIAQIKDQKIGPTLCSTFAGSAPGRCDACPFKGKISSPAQLGTQVVSAPPPAIQIVNARG